MILPSMSDELEPTEPQEDAVETDEESEETEDVGLRSYKFVLSKTLTRRLDQYLVDRIGYLSRNQVQQMIEDGFVKVNGRVPRSSYKPRDNDVVEVSAPPKKIETLVPENIPLEIVYEDEYMLAINKQANLVVHPARGVWTGTLVNGLVYYGKKWSTLNGDWRPGILHRLDRNTTGIMLVAKADEAHWRLARQFENRTIQKTYMAIAHGVPELRADVIDMPIGKDRYVREKMAVRKIEQGARSAITGYEVMETIDIPAGQKIFEFQKSPHPNDQHYRMPGTKFSLMKLSPKTGRTHQLRVHLSYQGWPIVGDLMYGGHVVHMLDDSMLFQRQALHAYEITFTHPITLEPMTLRAPLPPDIEKLLNMLRLAQTATKS